MTLKIDGFEKFVSLGKDNAEAVVKSSSLAVKGFEEIAKASQVYLTQSVEKTDAAVKALFAVKTPAEFADLQGKLARESIESAIAEGRKFAELSQSVITAALEPLNARIAAFQSLVKSAA
ncbi:MAG: phasin family protein [Magnetospirillum sp.]|nr:phasin family protein [Magnetospirillum sp.]